MIAPELVNSPHRDPSGDDGPRRLAVLIAVAASVMTGYVLLGVRPHKDVRMTDHRLTMVQADWVDAADVVFTGDSRSQAAYVPSAISGTVGCRLLNFGQQGRRYTARYFAAIDRVLDERGSIPTIVMGITPLSLSENGLPYSDQDEIFDPIDRWTTTHLDLFLASLQPMTKWDAIGLVRHGSHRMRRISDCEPDGWVNIERLPADPTAELPKYRSDFQQHRVDPDLEAGLLRQVAKWTTAGVLVVGERSPTSRAMLELEDQLSGFDEQDFARRFRAAGGRWFDGDRAAFDTWDGSHVTRDAALSHSAKLATFVLAERTASALRGPAIRAEPLQ